jgi:hypothetical protein
LMAWAFFQCTSLLGVVVYGESKSPVPHHQFRY